MLINSCLCSIDIIILTEINTQKSELPLYQLEDYNTFINTRETQRGGGILVYVRKKYEFQSINVNTNTCEVIHGQLMRDGYNPMHIIAVYRPSITIKQGFVYDLQRMLYNISTAYDIVVIGDTNIQLLGNNLGSAATRYKDVMCELGMQCAITDITREVVFSGNVVRSCLDHVWVRIQAYTSLYVLTCQVSDHYLIGVQIECDNRLLLSIISNRLVKQKLDDYPWQELMNCKYPLILYEKMCRVFVRIYGTSNKIIYGYSKKRATKVWINNKLKAMISCRDR